MPDQTGKQAVEARLYPPSVDRWSIIRELARYTEPERRRLLRPHAEMRFSNDKQGIADQRNRDRLDAALGALTALEIGYQTHIVEQKVFPVPEEENLKTLFSSEAFLRYVNAYLYFGIRFLARRIKNDWAYVEGVKDPVRDCNHRPFSLLTPPFPAPDATPVDPRFARLIALSTASDPALNPNENFDPKIRALRFLDGFTKDTAEGSDETSRESERYELWLRGLAPESKERQTFSVISEGLIAWALERSEFYLSLQSLDTGWPASGGAPQSPGTSRPVGGWAITNPYAARFALSDMYWIARLLRADVSADCAVTYTARSWLHLLRFHTGLVRPPRPLAPGELRPEDKLRNAEEILRSVFDFVCDLVQNAVEKTDAKDREIFEPEDLASIRHENDRRQKASEPNIARWRQVFDEELDQVEKQRNFREFKNTEPADSNHSDGWLARLKRERKTRNLVGVSFSGGGIRSATFNLGILQGLQELDLLRQIDYISTVSGGGFIGSWLVANVCRTRHWLGRLMNWDESIDHLRRYSNYLAPRLGAFTADTWTMWASWARNAFLIQLTCLAWLWTVLLAVHLGHNFFIDAGWRPFWVLGLASAMLLSVLCTLLNNLSAERAINGKPSGLQKKSILSCTQDGWLKERLPWLNPWLLRGKRPSSSATVWYAAVVPAWVASFIIAALLWVEANQKVFSGALNELKLHPTHHQPWYLWPALFFVDWLAMVLVAIFTLSRLSKRGRLKRIAYAGLFSTLCVIVLGLELSGIRRLFVIWSDKILRYQHGWYAYVLGPPMVLAAFTLSVVLFIGFCGRHSKESVREWWTRLGAGLAMFGAGYLALTTAAIFGPAWILALLHLKVAVAWGSILSWLGTVIAGLFAGKSSKTSGGNSRDKSPWLEILAKIGGFLFIVGAILAASTALYVVLIKLAGGKIGEINYWDSLKIMHPWLVGPSLFISFTCGVMFSYFFEINIFGLNQFYRFRLVRCYLGATRWAPGWRKPQPFTNFDGHDDMKLAEVFDNDFRGPFPIYNCALNLSGSADLALHTRHSASFSLTPLHCGADRLRVGYAATKDFAGGIKLGQAVAISGAAASPNMGFNTSALVAFLLTMFNVRLGWWFPNPGRKKWKNLGLNFSLSYLLLELFGVADEKSSYVNVSDGGHFENLGVYELVRRRCKVIFVCDAECDEFLQFGSLGNLVRMCETDFGAKIEIDLSSIRQQKNSFSLAHCAVGKVAYSNGSIGHIIYLKASVSGDEDVGVTQYRSVHPSFPHETTADQFFSEDQFESYRRLGLHVIRHSLRGTEPGDHPAAIAEKLADVLSPAGCSSEAFVKHTTTLDGIWERFRRSPLLHSFHQELMRQSIPEINAAVVSPTTSDPKTEELIIGLEMIQLMENVFLDLRLDDFWTHPDNRGWAILFMRWARSPRFRAVWNRTHRTFGIRFEYFCASRLGLSRDKPIVRV
jgi:hypothetical protein